MTRKLSAVQRVGVDTGGTFTDLVAVGRRGILQVVKVRSTPSNPSEAVLEGLRRLGVLRGEAPVIHGTTVGTNALLQLKGGRVALVTTSGFEDVLVLGRQSRPNLYRLDPPARAEMVPAQRRIGLLERTGPLGEILRPPTRGALRNLLQRLRKLRPDAVAVCLLHSYANPANENAVGKLLQGEGWHVSLSHRVAGEFREYERTCTTLVNALLAKPMEGYLAELDRRIGARRLSVMGSSGGWMTARRASELPVRTVLSGPAGGLTAAAILGRAVAPSGLITLDMGGTSTDLAVCAGEIPRVARTTLNGIPLMIPALDIRSLGAGGGSIARRDAGGALRVGPESAGADPGPACYSKGGTGATLTDAHLALGRLPAEGLLGGEIPLDAAASRRALGRLGRSLGIGVEQVARGILRVVETTLERAVRSLVAERGMEPAALSLLVFGGAGGLHACALARSLGIGHILIPRDPGTFSALGLALSAATWETSRTVLIRLRRPGEGDWERLASKLEQEGVARLRREGHSTARLRRFREADLRYAGQSHELTLPLGPDLTGRFHAAHQREFGYSRMEDEVELVTLRVRLEAAAPYNRLRPWRRPGRSSKPSQAGGRSGPHGQGIRVYARDSLAPGVSVTGPALITEYGATTYLAEDFRLAVGGAGELRLTTRQKGRR